MKLIAEKRSKNDLYDVLRFVRNNGSCTDTLMPRQGILPHDLLHSVVESALPLRHGFLSLVARGADVEQIMAAVHDPSNYTKEQRAVQTEDVVSGLQAELWQGELDEDGFLDGAAQACHARARRPFDFSSFDVRSCLYERALALHRQWSAAPYYSTLSLEFVPGAVFALAGAVT
jgi:hypothetical protein